VSRKLSSRALKQRNASHDTDVSKVDFGGIVRFPYEATPMSKPLTDATIRDTLTVVQQSETLKKLFVGDGLFSLVQPNGSRL
jgi:hypothetical protein